MYMCSSLKWQTKCIITKDIGDQTQEGQRTAEETNSEPHHPAEG